MVSVVLFVNHSEITRAFGRYTEKNRQLGVFKLHNLAFKDALMKVSMTINMVYVVSYNTNSQLNKRKPIF